MSPVARTLTAIADAPPLPPSSPRPTCGAAAQGTSPTDVSSDYSPYSAFHRAERDAGSAYDYPNGIPEEFLKMLQDEWQEGFDKREAMRKKPLALLARAEQVQPLVSRVV